MNRVSQHYAGSDGAFAMSMEEFKDFMDQGSISMEAQSAAVKAKAAKLTKSFNPRDKQEVQERLSINNTLLSELKAVSKQLNNSKRGNEQATVRLKKDKVKLPFDAGNTEQLLKNTALFRKDITSLTKRAETAKSIEELNKVKSDLSILKARKGKVASEFKVSRGQALKIIQEYEAMIAVENEMYKKCLTKDQELVSKGIAKESIMNDEFVDYEKVAIAQEGIGDTISLILGWFFVLWGSYDIGAGVIFALIGILTGSLIFFVAGAVATFVGYLLFSLGRRILDDYDEDRKNKEE